MVGTVKRERVARRTTYTVDADGVVVDSGIRTRQQASDVAWQQRRRHDVDLVDVFASSDPCEPIETWSRCRRCRRWVKGHDRCCVLTLIKGGRS